MRLYHVCDQNNLASILQTGLRAGTYLTSCEDVASYYAETFEDEDQVPVYLEIELDELIEAVGEDAIEPDHPSVAEPITSAIGMSEDEVMAAWSGVQGTWQDSLDIVRSVKVLLPIPVSIIKFEQPYSEPRL